MTKGELKSIIKEAIMELVADGALSSGNGPKIVRKEEKTAIQEQKKIRATQMIQKHLSGPNDPYAALLADTAQNTILAEQERDTYGTTIEAREQFDSMFPDDLRELFHSQFPKR